MSSGFAGTGKQGAGLDLGDGHVVFLLYCPGKFLQDCNEKNSMHWVEESSHRCSLPTVGQACPGLSV